MDVYDIFTPTGVPSITYVDREEKDLEGQLRQALRTPGVLTSLSGPSKSGKTVLINRVISSDNLIQISGGAISDADKLWDRVLNWMEAPSNTVTSKTRETGGTTTAKVSAKASALIASGSAEGSISGTHSRGHESAETHNRSGIDQVIREIANSEFIIFIDDFHYMDRSIQSDVSRQIKEAAEKGVKICTASVPHRADDVVRGNPELRGRVSSIDFEYWADSETEKIAQLGFSKLNLNLPSSTIKGLSREAFGSPQLMQRICLELCLHLGIEQTLENPTEMDVDQTQLQDIFEKASRTTDYSTLLEALHAGPKQRGTTRNQFQFTDGTTGDVYRCILLALKDNPPKLSLTYDDIYQRTRSICLGEAPAGSSVSQAMEKIHYISESIQANTEVLEWSEDVFDIVDPYFLYYLRCSPRLNRLGNI